MEHRSTNLDPHSPQIPSESFTPPLWQWQSGPSPDPWSETDPSKFSWQSYSDSDSLIIEQAFSLGQDRADLNQNYEIDLKKMLQVNKKDQSRIRRVRRQEKSRFMIEIPQPEILPKEADFLEFLLIKAPEAISLHQKLRSLPLDCPAEDFRDVLEDVIVSIEKAGEINQKISEAESLVSLMKEKTKTLKDFLKIILRIYASESFLCYYVNELLQKENLHGISPFLISLLYSFQLPEHIMRSQEPQGLMKSLARIVAKPKLELYKGTAIAKKDIETLYNPEKTKYLSWRNFTSTTKEKSIAMNYVRFSIKKTQKAPVLFIIQAEYDTENMVEISQISCCPEEKEVILLPGTVYQLKKVHFTAENLYEIHLKIINKNEEKNLSIKPEETIIIIEKLPSQKSLKLLTSLKQKKNLQRLEIRNSGLDENLLKEIANLNLNNVKFAGNTIVVSSLIVLVCHFRPENLQNILLLNNIRFKKSEKDPLPNQETLKNLSLTPEILQRFSNSQQLKHLWNDTKTLTNLTSLEICAKTPYRTDPNEEFFEMVHCTSQLKALENLTLLLHRTDSPQNLQYLFSIIASKPTLKKLSLQLILTNKDLSQLSDSLISLKNLQDLTLNLANSYELTDLDLSSLKNLPLKSLALNFSMCRISDSSLISLLENLTELRSLTLNLEYCSNITDKTLKSLLLPLVSLRILSLSLGKNSNITDEGLVFLTNSLQSIKSLDNLSLDFNECAKISDDGILSLKEIFQYLNSLSLNFRRCPQVSSNGLVAVKKGFNRTLKKVALSFAECKEIWDEGFEEYVSHFKWIENLSLDFSLCPQITDKALQFLEKNNVGMGISSMSDLKYLSLGFSGCEKISDSGLISVKSSLRNKKELQYLSLNFSACTQITDEGFSHVISGLVSLKNLKQLSLDFGKCYRITNKGFGYLANALVNLADLEDFSFECPNSPHITDEGLSYLKIGVMALGNLKRLRVCLWACREISQEARHWFKSELMPLISFEFE